MSLSGVLLKTREDDSGSPHLAYIVMSALEREVSDSTLCLMSWAWTCFPDLRADMLAQVLRTILSVHRLALTLDAMSEEKSSKH